MTSQWHSCFDFILIYILVDKKRQGSKILLIYSFLSALSILHQASLMMNMQNIASSPEINANINIKYLSMPFSET